MKKVFLHLATVISFVAIVSCSLLPESGPLNIVSDYENHKLDVNYEVIDVTSQNLEKVNVRQSQSVDKLPSVDSKRTFSDQIQRGDLINMFVIDPSKESLFSSGEAIGPLEVSQEGTINVPFIGSLDVAQKSINEVEALVKEKFALKFNTAEISVSRTKKIQFRANVIGLVARPGQHTIDRPDFTLSDLVSLSGGTSIDPHLCEYQVHRNGKTYTVDGKTISKNKSLIQDGDVLEVIKSRQQHLVILGNVKRPGNHPFPSPNSNLIDFIGSSSGIDLSTGDPSGIFIFRKQAVAKTKVYRFNLRVADGLIAANKFSVHGGDVVYVTEAPLSRWNRILRNALPIGQVQGVTSLTN
jgi:polysaccharide biosynthesis/export protein